MNYLLLNLLEKIAISIVAIVGSVFALSALAFCFSEIYEDRKEKKKDNKEKALFFFKEDNGNVSGKSNESNESILETEVLNISIS